MYYDKNVLKLNLQGAVSASDLGLSSQLDLDLDLDLDPLQLDVGPSS